MQETHREASGPLGSKYVPLASATPRGKPLCAEVIGAKALRATVDHEVITVPDLVLDYDRAKFFGSVQFSAEIENLPILSLQLTTFAACRVLPLS